MRLLKVGVPIVQRHMSPSDWEAYVAELQPGDEIRYWLGSYEIAVELQSRVRFSDAVSEFTLIKRGQE